MTNSAIATELVILATTVKHHMGAVYPKLDISIRAELAAISLDAAESGKTSMDRHQFRLGGAPTSIRGS